MQYTLQTPSGTIMQVNLTGRFSYMDSPAFRTIVRSFMTNKKCQKVQLNLKDLEAIDCTGGRMLMMMHDFAKKAHCSMIFVGASGQVLDKLNEYALHNAICIAA